MFDRKQLTYNCGAEEWGQFKLYFYEEKQVLLEAKKRIEKLKNDNYTMIMCTLKDSQHQTISLVRKLGFRKVARSFYKYGRTDIINLYVLNLRPVPKGKVK